MSRSDAAPGTDAAPEAPAPARPGSGDRALFESFVELAGREMGRGRTLSDLAEALGATASALDTACRRQRGRSALEVLYDLRLDRARRLLSDAATPLSAIAAELEAAKAAITQLSTEG